ncbi:MAG: MFS transporter [Geminicoccaceae bacterium]|nr:MFS transporter [Geminicoccaceae bacterium]
MDDQQWSSALRLAGFYGTMFGAIGIHLPFWPVWLESARGMTPGEVGLLLAAMYWPRVVASLVLARLADRSGSRKRLVVALAATGFVTTALFAMADGFWPLLALSLLSGAAMSGLLPLGEATALEEARATGFDYARVRLVGSLTFVLAAAGAGLAVERHGADLILPLLLLSLGVVLIACLTMPDGRRPAARGGGLAIAQVARLDGLWPVLTAAALIQVSHAVYYGFATLHWRAAGLGGGTIGWLWAEAVVAEVILFGIAGPLVARSRPASLLVAVAVLGAARWLGTAATTDLAALMVIQALHAATFGLTHLATMRHLQDVAPAHALATAQGLFASLLALLFGLMTPLAGWLYGGLGRLAFLVMAGLPVVAMLLLFASGRARRASSAMP